MASTRTPGLIALQTFDRLRNVLLAFVGLIRRWVRHRRAPHVVLALVCLLGIGARVFHLGIPSKSGRASKAYIFDENYYVAAAHVIDGKTAVPGDVYAHASPAGTDPNGEHPQLAKIIIAGSIDVFGDNAIGWRVTAVVFGLAAILLLYWLVRCAGGSQWLGVGAAALASGDNLWIVSSRIAVLDIYVVPFMLAGAALYLRRRPVAAGVALGVGGTAKEFAVYGLFALLLLEAMRGLSALWDRWRARAHPVGGSPPAGTAATTPLAPQPPQFTFHRLLMPVKLVLVTGVTFLTVLSGLDALVHPYNSHRRVDRHESNLCSHLWIWTGGPWSGACNHFVFMNRYASTIKDKGAPRGIASDPVQWWIDRKPIGYFTVTRTVRVHNQVVSTIDLILFRGEISRVLLFTSWLAILLNVWWALRRRDELSLLAIAWILGTWLPPALLHLLDSRTTYLYYMVTVMPGIYIAVARLLAVRWIRKWLLVFWIAGFLVDFAALYPFRTLSGT